MPTRQIARTAAVVALATLLAPAAALADTGIAAGGFVLAEGVLDGAIRGALIGAVVGGAIGGVAWLLKKNKKP